MGIRIILVAGLLFSSFLYGGDVTVTLINGKTFKAKLEKIEASKYDADAKDREEVKGLNVAQGQNEYMIPFEKMQSITFATRDDMSTYEDSSFSPIRKFVRIKMTFVVKLKTADKSKDRIEIVDDRKFILTFAEKTEPPVTAFFNKVMVSDKGREFRVTFKEIEDEAKELEKNGIKSIIFN